MVHFIVVVVIAVHGHHWIEIERANERSSFVLHRFDFHPGDETLLPPTRLTSIAHGLVDNAPIRAQTRVLDVLAHGALEEALAALARDHTVVSARRLVTAHHTEQETSVDLLVVDAYLRLTRELKVRAELLERSRANNRVVRRLLLLLLLHRINR